MKKILIVTATAVAAAALIQAQSAIGQTTDSATLAPVIPASAANIVMVPKGTVFIVATRRSYKSYGASTGTKVSYDLTQDVIVNGYIIAKIGDSAQGEILNAHEGKAAGFFTDAQGANLRLSVDRVFTFCGDAVETDFARSEYRRRQGAFGGKVDLEISKGQKYSVPSERVQKVCGEKTDAVQMPVPGDALAGDKD